MSQGQDYVAVGLAADVAHVQVSELLQQLHVRREHAATVYVSADEVRSYVLRHVNFDDRPASLAALDAAPKCVLPAEPASAGTARWADTSPPPPPPSIRHSPDRPLKAKKRVYVRLSDVCAILGLTESAARTLLPRAPDELVRDEQGTLFIARWAVTRHLSPVGGAAAAMGNVGAQLSQIHELPRCRFGEIPAVRPGVVPTARTLPKRDDRSGSEGGRGGDNPLGRTCIDITATHDYSGIEIHADDRQRFH